MKYRRCIVFKWITVWDSTIIFICINCALCNTNNRGFDWFNSPVCKNDVDFGQIPVPKFHQFWAAQLFEFTSFRYKICTFYQKMTNALANARSRPLKLKWLRLGAPKIRRSCGKGENRSSGFKHSGQRSTFASEFSVLKVTLPQSVCRTR